METFWLMVSFKLSGYKFELEFDKIKKVMEVTVDSITVAAADANGIDDFEWYLTEVKRIMRLNHVGGFVIPPKKLRKIAKLTDQIEDIIKLESKIDKILKGAIRSTHPNFVTGYEKG